MGIKVIIILTGLILILIVINQIQWSLKPQPTTTTTLQTTTTVTTTTTIQPKIITGRIIIAVKDYKLPGGTTILNISMKIGNITVHYVNESRWIVVSSDMKTIQLLNYTNITAIIGQSEMETGKYTQIRLYITEANITIKNTLLKIYTGKTYPMVVPSKELKVVHQFNIEGNKTTVLTLDFDVENSVTHTADGYMLRPVVKVYEQRLEYGRVPENAKIIE